jgi:hypothetical protein
VPTHGQGVASSGRRRRAFRLGSPRATGCVRLVVIDVVSVPYRTTWACASRTPLECPGSARQVVLHAYTGRVPASGRRPRTVACRSRTPISSARCYPRSRTRLWIARLQPPSLRRPPGTRRPNERPRRGAARASRARQPRLAPRSRAMEGLGRCWWRASDRNGLFCCVGGQYAADGDRQWNRR